MKRISLTFQGHRQYRLGQVRLRVSDPGSWGASTHLQEMHFPCMRCKRDKTYPWLHPWKWKWQKINKIVVPISKYEFLTQTCSLPEFCLKSLRKISLTSVGQSQRQSDKEYLLPMHCNKMKPKIKMGENASFKTSCGALPIHSMMNPW